MYLTSPPDHSSGHNTVNSKCKCNKVKYMHILFLFSWFNRLTYCWKNCIHVGQENTNVIHFVVQSLYAQKRVLLDDRTPFGVASLLEPLCMRVSWFCLFRPHGKNGSAEGKMGQKTKLYTPGNHCAPWGGGNKVVIQSTLTGKVTNQLKGQLWQDIAVKVSNCGVCLQTSDQVREKFSNIKK